MLHLVPTRARRPSRGIYATKTRNPENPQHLCVAQPLHLSLYEPTPPPREVRPVVLVVSECAKELQGSIQTVFTLATAERYLLSRMRGFPVLPSHSQKFHESWWVPRWGKDGKQGEVFVFANGSFVCWGLEEDEAHRFAVEIIGRIPGIEVPETEELEFVVDPLELRRDLIILGKNPPLTEIAPPAKLPSMVFPEETLFARYAFSQALSRSTALSALEVALDEYLSSMALLPHSLAKTGKPGMGRTALPELEKYFMSVSDALDVKVRTDSVNDKITYAAEAQSVLRQLLTESSTTRMELIIIALIAVEVVIALIRDGPSYKKNTAARSVKALYCIDPSSDKPVHVMSLSGSNEG
ncbi:hypothetical protein K438DRAFT_2089154 [Mycena galopus ATCC 62051]|nr:hypothetical protein K438DRAFT_2089154 [Mycena galopus ATCC 62051]